VQTFDARVRSRLEGLHFTSPAWTAIDRELPKMAGADVEAVPAIEQSKRRAARQAIDEAFVSAFRLVMMSAAVLALAAAIAGSLVR